MSDANTAEDPLVQHLTERKRELEDLITQMQARLSEVDGLLTAASDGRSRLSRRRRGNGPARSDAELAKEQRPQNRPSQLTYPEPGPAMEAAPP